MGYDVNDTAGNLTADTPRVAQLSSKQARLVSFQHEFATALAEFDEVERRHPVVVGVLEELAATAAQVVEQIDSVIGVRS